ncbi:uncharacterized protein [Argopecten irradians]|uniref:uncharacterized protein isoform X2 n=1 Tax=Argopecten irradians TaxID=31199 RepID=UPI003718D822
MKMDYLKLVFILLCGVQIGKCASWTVTVYISELYVYNHIQIILNIYGTRSSRAVYTGNNLVQNEERVITTDIDFGKINEIAIYMSYYYYYVFWINVQKVVLYDGIHTYRFTCDCILKRTVYKKLTPHDMSPFEIDPCSISTPEQIPNVRMYRPANTQPNTHSISLTEGWYTGGQYQLLTKSPDLDLARCGAESQIWMNGTFPDADEMNHPRQLCITNRTTGDTCVNNMTALVTNCTTHVMYYLSTPPSDSAYCFDTDPCSYSSPRTIPNVESYRPTNTDPNSPRITLTEGWYSGGQYQLLTRSPELDGPRCGAESQIWMNGTLPAADGKQHAVPLCVTNQTTGEKCKNEKMTTYVTNCTSHIMYDLPSPPTNSAYCFDIPSDSNDTPPSYRPTRVKVKFELLRNGGLMSNNAHDSDVNPFLRFHCDFERDENNAYFYVIYFYVDGSYVNFGTELVVYDTGTASVTEGTLMSKFGLTAGITITCSVGARASKNGRTGSLVTSEGFYAGIKLLNQSISIERGHSGTVYFKQTVPFGCALSSPWVVNSDNCKLKLHVMKTSTENVCHSNTLHHRGQCAIEIQGLTTATSSDVWDPQTYSVELVSVESMRALYGLTTRQFFFHLETSSSHHQFWGNAKSDSVQVNVNEGSDDHVWQGKQCQVFCDPHMRSFDGMQYELQYPGKFLLFKHENIPIQVQVEITSCYGSRTPYCACGLVVVAGKDVFQIYLCNRPYDIRYQSCLDGVLTVVKQSNANYKIYLPTGSVIHVAMRMHRGLLDIYITPTVHEYRGRISGLCGDLDGHKANDCVSKGGSMPCEEPVTGQWGYRYHPNSFTQSYRLHPTEVLLNIDINTDSLPSYPRSHETCSCTNVIHATAQCSSRQYALCTNPRNQVKCTSVKQNSLRKKRQAEHSNSYEHHGIIKRAAVFNESEAIQLCTAALNTVANEACSHIGVNSSSDEINNCAADLMLTGDGNWTKYAIDRSESSCLETLEKNTTLQEENPDISNIIRNNTCPLNCSEQGSCSNGKCMCQEGFASDDCSFDLSKPLEIHGLENDGLCDIDDSCSYVVVEGLEFPSDINITCQFSGQATLVGEISHTLDVSNVTADPNTLFTVICELPVIDTPSDRLGIQYNVSVAMDGFEFSEAINFVVIDTACQDFFNSSGKITFYIKDGFCFINETCYPEGSYKENALCLECRPRENLHMWSNSTNEDCVVSDKETEDPTSDVIIIVISAVTGSLSVCLLVCVLWCFCKKKDKSKQVVEDISINDDVDEEEGKPCIAWLNDEELNTSDQMEKSKALRPKWNQWTRIPEILSDKQKSQSIDTQNSVQILNESVKCVEIADHVHPKETSNHVQRAISVDDVFDRDDKQTSIFNLYSNVKESRIQIDTENERENMDGDITLGSPNPETGFKFWIYNENQSTTDVGTNDLSSRGNSKEVESEQPSRVSADKGSQQKKKKKRKRRKIEPECSIGDLAIITEDDNDRREKRKSRKKSKRQKKEISHHLNETNTADDKCDDNVGIPFASLSNEGTSGSRTDMRTEHDDHKADSTDSHIILVRPNTKPNLDFVNTHEVGLKHDMSKRNTETNEPDIVKPTPIPNPGISDTSGAEQDLNCDTYFTNPPEDRVALTNPFLKDEVLASEPRLLETILGIDMSENKRKSNKKKRRQHQEEELESAIVDREVMTDEQYTRKRKKKSKKRDIENMDDISKSEDNKSKFCPDEELHVVTKKKEEASDLGIERVTGNDTDKTTSSQNDHNLESPRRKLFADDEANIETQSVISVASDNSGTEGIIVDGEPAQKDTLLPSTATVEKGKRKKKNKRRRKKKKVVPLPSNGNPSLASNKGKEKKAPKKSKTKNIRKK